MLLSEHAGTAPAAGLSDGPAAPGSASSLPWLCDFALPGVAALGLPDVLDLSGESLAEGSAGNAGGAEPLGRLAGAVPGIAEPVGNADPEGSAEPDGNAEPEGRAEPGGSAEPAAGVEPAEGTGPAAGSEPAGKPDPGNAEPDGSAEPDGGVELGDAPGWFGNAAGSGSSDDPPAWSLGLSGPAGVGGSNESCVDPAMFRSGPICWTGGALGPDIAQTTSRTTPSTPAMAIARRRQYTALSGSIMH